MYTTYRVVKYYFSVIVMYKCTQCKVPYCFEYRLPSNRTQPCLEARGKRPKFRNKGWVSN